MPNFLRNHAHFAILIELLFAILLVAIFWISQGRIFWLENSPITIPDGGASPVHSSGLDPATRTAEQPSVSQQACTNLVVNGGFETFGGWSLPLTNQPAAFSSDTAVTGNRSLFLGLTEADLDIKGESRALQSVTLPADAASIELRAQIQRSGTRSDTEDLHYIVLEAKGTQFPALEGYSNDAGWQPFTYDLASLAGQEVRLIFGVLNDGQNGRASMHIDDVEVVACRSDRRSPVAQTQATTASQPASQLLPGRGFMEPDLFVPGVMVTDRERSGDGDAPPEPTTPVQAEGEPDPACKELVENGGFEDDDEWITPLTDSPGQFTSDRAASGSRSGRVGIHAGDANILTDSTLYQHIDLPAGMEQIRLEAQVWQAGQLDDRDVHYLWIVAGGHRYPVFQTLSNARTWETVEYDLTPFSGQDIFLLIGTYNNGIRGQAFMYVDNVSIAACTETVSTYLSIPETEPATPTPEPEYAPPARVDSPDYGVNAFLWQHPEVAERDLELIRAGGFRWVRQRFAWQDIEPEDDQHLWTQSDRVVQQTNQVGLNLLARLGANPEFEEFWAGRPPESTDKFVEFVTELSRRYNCTPNAAGCIQAYQIWNEPNQARHWGGSEPDPAAYVEMLGQAYMAIKEANPNAIVISAGMAPTATEDTSTIPDVRFYQEMYRAMQGDSRGYFDLLGVNAPGFAAPPEASPAQTARNPDYGGARVFAFRHVEDIREIMVTYEDQNTGIAILEFGWTSDPINPGAVWHGANAGIDEFVKAEYLQQAYQWAEENWQPWIGMMMIFTMPNLDWIEDGNPFDEEHYWWAIMEPSQIDEIRLRPAFVTLCIYLNEKQGTECPFRAEQDG